MTNSTPWCRAALLAGLAMSLQAPVLADVVIYDIAITKRHLYGPGPFPDQALGAGHVKSMHFDSFMNAKVPAFNNGAAEPNASGEARQGSTVDGMMSDGTKLNEHIDMGNAVILNGQFNLVLGAVFNGPNEGASYFFLDDDFNWTIKDDIAMDPGFAEGVVKVDDFIFSTGPKPVPFSIQTDSKYPGGIDKVGSLQSGDITVGRIGDDDLDGRVDGIFFAMGQFPLNAAFLPGAPFVQRVHFVSDIPLGAADAGLLAAATARNCLRVRLKPPARASMERSESVLRDCTIERTATAIKHLRRATEDKAKCARNCRELSAIAEQLQKLEQAGTSKPEEDLSVLERAVTRIAEMQGRTRARKS